MKPLLALIFLLPFTAVHAADEQPLSLSGEWVGHWTDTRPEYSKSGGDFTCVVVEKSPNVWTCTFKISKTHEWTVELKGKKEKEAEKLVFGGTEDLGGKQGLYTWKATLNAAGFSGEYVGPDEKGTFKMQRAEVPKTPDKK